MKYKHFRDPEKREYHFNPLRTVIACVLIAAVLFSLSIGLGYSKYTYMASPIGGSYNVKARVYNSPMFVVQKRVAGEDTVLETNDGLIKVTVPADATGANLNEAEYLMLYTVNKAVNTFLDYSGRQNVFDYYVVLTSIKFNTALGGLHVVTDDTKSISAQVDIGKYAVIDPRYSSPNTTTVPNQNYDEDTGIFTFENMANIRTGFTIRFDRKTWLDYADTSWYEPGYDVYNIATPEQLAGVSKLVNDGTESFENKTICLTEDISLYSDENQLESEAFDKRGWQPIGYFDHPFMGSFNGNNHTISGLNVYSYNDVDFANERTAGLFGMVKGDGTIKDFTLTDVNLSPLLGVNSRNEAGESVTNSGQSLGAVVGRSEGYRIENVHVDGLDIYGNSKYIGGILGRGDVTGGVYNCSVENAVFGAGDHGTSSAKDQGGIIGIQYGEDVNVENCYVQAVFEQGHVSSGGIIGFACSATGIKNCYFTGEFKNEEESAVSAGDAYNYGGIVGEGFSRYDSDYTINNCYCDADVPADKFIFANCIIDGSDAQMIADYESGASTDVPDSDSRMVIGNSSWKADVDSFSWYSIAYDDGYLDRMGTVDKSGDCWFTAGMSYDDFLQALADGGELPALTATEAPTTAPTQAPSAVPTVAPTVSATE